MVFSISNRKTSFSSPDLPGPDLIIMQEICVLDFVRIKRSNSAKIEKSAVNRSETCIYHSSAKIQIKSPYVPLYALSQRAEFAKANCTNRGVLELILFYSDT